MKRGVGGDSGESEGCRELSNRFLGNLRSTIFSESRVNWNFRKIIVRGVNKIASNQKKAIQVFL